jgi:DNA primase
VVVEGYMDVIACQRADVPAVAPLGTALTEGQMELLWRLHPTPTLCFDADKAGQRAAARAIERALPLLKPGRSFVFAALAGGKDPDDVLRDQGKAALKAQLAATRPLVEVLFETENPGLEALKTPEDRTALKVRLRKLAATIADADLSQAYRDDLLARYEGLWPLEKPARTYADAARALSRRGWQGRDRKGTSPPGPASPMGLAAARGLSDAPKPIAAALVQAAIDHPALVEDRIEVLGVQGFLDEKLERIAKAILDLRFQVDELDSEGLKRHLAERGWQPLLQEISSQAAKAGIAAPFLNPDLDEARVRALWSRTFDILVEIASLERALDQAKRDLERHADITEMLKLKAQRDALWRQVRSGEIDADVALGRDASRDISLH